MNGRVEVNRALPPAVVPARVWNELRGHALETRPEECCGLLLGPSAGGFERIERCRNEMTRLHRQDPALYPRDGNQAFHMNEIDYVRIRERAESQGLRVAGVYHSHIGAGAYFSELDQAFALQPLFPFPDADHVVISVVEQRVRDLAVFRRLPGTRIFEGRPLAPGAP